MITVALVSPQLVTPVNQKLTHSEEFGEPEAAPRPCSFTHSASAEVPLLGPWVLAARTALSPPATILTLTRLHTLSHWEPRGREAAGKRIFMWWLIRWIAIGKKMGLNES